MADLWPPEVNDERANSLIAQMLGSAGLRVLGQDKAPIDATPNDYEFIERYRPTLDNGSFDWNRYEHLMELYEDEARFLVLMCGAQTGKTARLMTHLVRRMVLFWGAMFGYYLPDYKLAEPFSQRRLGPFIRSIRELAPHLGTATTLQKGADATFVKTLGPSSVLFLSTRGGTATEGLPLKGIYLDEVRQMTDGQIELAMERYSAQTDPFDVKVSTAGYPDTDIDRFFQASDQRFYHSDSGPDGYVLSLNWPDCILDLRNATPAMKRKVEHAFHRDRVPLYGLSDAERGMYPAACFYDHKRGEVITDPRRGGWWEPRYPGRRAHGYNMPQLLSNTFSAGKILDKHENSRDHAEFVRSVLGRAFIDESMRPVKDEHLLASIDLSEHWHMTMTPRWRKENSSNVCMGVDAQAGYLIVVVKKRAPSGRWVTIHVEVAYEGSPGKVGTDPWKRLGRLMGELDVRACVIDWAPHWNEALRFAKHFRGRVWLASYGGDNDDGDMIVWRDLEQKKSKRGEDGRFKHTVRIHRTKGLRWSLGRWGKRQNAVPDPGRLVQTLPHQGETPELSSGLRVGRWQSTPVCRTLYFPHQRGIVFRDLFEDAKKHADKQRQMKQREVAERVGPDPHFAHANLYADVAMDRFGA